MTSGDRAAAVRAGTEASVEAVRPIFAGMHNAEAILDAVRACMQAAEAQFLDQFDALCTRDPEAGREAFFAEMAPISRHCSEEAVKLTE